VDGGITKQKEELASEETSVCYNSGLDRVALKSHAENKLKIIMKSIGLTT